MARLLRIATLSVAAIAGLAVVLAATGWTYLLRPHAALPGPGVADALPLDELSKHSGVTLPVFLLVWTVAAALLGLTARLARVERLTAGLFLALALGLWGYLETSVSILVVRQIPAEDAFRAGATVEDIEFVQFHPTALFVPNAPRFLLSEALRGEGAYLRNASGERFMERYHPLKELAPRDVVSRSIVLELRASGDPSAFLDLTHLPAGFVRKRFPRIYETCVTYGVDLETTLAPVRPAAHYAMGGVQTDLDGQTTLPRLFAAGEAACTGVHGANRLASNSLLEGVVFGARAGRAMTAARALPRVAATPPTSLFPAITERDLRAIAWNSCGVLRSGPELAATSKRLAARCFESQPSPDRAAFELRNMHQVASLIALAALAREESRGGHYRTDFPSKSNLFEKHSRISAHRNADATVLFS